MQYAKLPLETVVCMVKGLGHGCSVEAAPDVCEVDACTVARLLERAGPQAEDFHRLQLEGRPSTSIQVQFSRPNAQGRCG